MLERTTRSGKRLFLCRACRRESTTPDKTCPAGCGVELKLWSVQVLREGGVEEWLVAAPDRAIAREVVLEHEVSPECRMVMTPVEDADRPISIVYDSHVRAAGRVPTASVAESLLVGGWRYTAPARDWLAMFTLPGVVRAHRQPGPPSARSR